MLWNFRFVDVNAGKIFCLAQKKPQFEVHTRTSLIPSWPPLQTRFTTAAVDCPGHSKLVAPTVHKSRRKLPKGDQDGYRQKRENEEGKAGESGGRNGKRQGQRGEFLPIGQAGQDSEHVQRRKSRTECQRKGHKSSQLSKSRKTESPCRT